MKKIRTKFPIHYVLSGGAAKGFIHIGAIKALEQIGIYPASITGTSAGALFGALYALYGNSEKTIEKINQFMNSLVYKNFKEKYFSIDIGNKKTDKSINKESIYSFFKEKERFKDKFAKISTILSEKFSSFIKNTKVFFNLFDDEALIEAEDINNVYIEIFGNINIENLKIPFLAVSSDITYKTAYCFKKGDLVTAILASTSIPFIFPSVKIENKILYDGGIVSNLPARESIDNFGHGIRIGIDVTSPVQKLDEDANFIEIIQQIIGTSIYAKQLSDRRLCDIVFIPLDQPVGWFQFDLKDQLIELGYKYVIERNDEIVEKIEKISKNRQHKKGIFGFLKI